MTAPELEQKPPLPEHRADSLDWARLRFERQKLALELRAKRRELAEERNRSVWKGLLANPLSVVIVGGILTLMTTVVTNFITAQANREAEQSRAVLARQSAQQTLQADLIKKFVEGPRPEIVRENLRFLADSGLIPEYAASIQKYLAANPGLAPQVGSRLDFSPAGEAVSEVLKERLRDTVARFRTFLQSKGFNNLDDGVSVFIYSKDAPPPAARKISSEDPNSFYSENTLYIHKALSEDLSIALREFTHYALLKAVGEELFRQTAVESALADYLPATFLKSPVIGSGFAKTASHLGFRTLDNNWSYDAEATKGPGGWFPRGIVWAGTLWTCRNPEQPEAVDNLILPAWHKASVLPLDDDFAEARFGAALAAAPLPQGACFKEQIARRRLPIRK
jgi:hypothetical protein